MKNNKVLGDFKVFAAAKEILENSIGISILHDVTMFPSDSYAFNGHELQWIKSEGEFLLSEEARLMREFEDCEMYLVHSCTGDEYIAVFDKSNKVDG